MIFVLKPSKNLKTKKVVYCFGIWLRMKLVFNIDANHGKKMKVNRLGLKKMITIMIKKIVSKKVVFVFRNLIKRSYIFFHKCKL